jgi:hypothetical protein
MSEDSRPHVIRDAKGKRPEFFDAPGLDQAMSMIMVLASELTVLRDRLDSAERVAKGQGIDLAAGIEALELDQASLETREAWRQDFLGRLFYVARKDASEAAAAESAEGYRQVIEDIAEG